MAYLDTLEEKVREYCRVRNIPIIRGQISEDHKKEIQNFIISERRKSQKTYARNKSTDINKPIKSILGDSKWRG